VLRQQVIPEIEFQQPNMTNVGRSPPVNVSTHETNEKNDKEETTEQLECWMPIRHVIGTVQPR
jgi:hypothetical protein